MSGATAPLSHRAVRGTAWVAGLRIYQRGVGVARLLLLTALLGPEHFGQMGVALLLLELLNAFSQTGFQTALIQREGRVEPYLDAAWTALLLRGAALYALIFAGAPFAASFFGEAAVTPLIRVVGLSVLLQAAGNVGVVVLERQLEFRRVAWHQMLGATVDLVAAVSAALLLGNAWAFAVGLLAGETSRLVTSYVVHPHRPRLRFDGPRMRELFAFGRWMLLTNAFLFLAHQGDDVLVGRWLGVAALGLYQLAYQLSHLTILELTRILSQVALPSYARLQHDLPALRRAHLKVLQGTALLSWPLAGLVFLFAPDFTRLVLAERWQPIAPVVQILALHAGVRALGATLGPVLIAMGRPHLVTALTGLKCAVLAALIFPLLDGRGLEGAALAVLGASLVSNAAANGCVMRVLDCRPAVFFSVLAVPLAATVGMGAGVTLLRDLVPVGGVPALALHVLVAVGVYALLAAGLGRGGPYPTGAWVQTALAQVALARAPQEDRP